MLYSSSLVGSVIILSLRLSILESSIWTSLSVGGRSCPFDDEDDMDMVEKDGKLDMKNVLFNPRSLHDFSIMGTILIVTEVCSFSFLVLS